MFPGGRAGSRCAPASPACGRSAATTAHKGDFHQWIYYDLLYVRHLSLWLDLKILALTPLSFMRSGYIPLRWLLAPEKYGERRAARRESESEAVAGPIRG